MTWSQTIGLMVAAVAAIIIVNWAATALQFPDVARIAAVAVVGLVAIVVVVRAGPDHGRR